MPSGVLPLTGRLIAQKSIRVPWGRLIWTTDPGEALTAGVFRTSLSVTHIRNDGSTTDHDLGSGVITDAGVTLMAADWTNANATIKLINYHDSGTGTASAAVTDTALSIPTGQARATGTQSNINNVYSTVGVITYSSTYEIAEWGLFTASSGGVLFDRRSFGSTPIAVESGNQLRWVYFLTLPSGG